jgi:hypothetical protein
VATEVAPLQAQIIPQSESSSNSVENTAEEFATENNSAAESLSTNNAPETKTDNTPEIEPLPADFLEETANSPGNSQTRVN